MKFAMNMAAKGAFLAWALVSALPAEAQSIRTQAAFANCDAARAAGRVPIYQEESGYGPHLDRDNDGIGCNEGLAVAGADDADVSEVSEDLGPPLELDPNTAKTIRPERSVRIVVIGNPEIASATVASDQVLVVTAKSKGVTNLVALNEEGEEVLRRRVFVGVPARQAGIDNRKLVRVRSVGGGSRRGSGELIRVYDCSSSRGLCTLNASKGETPPTASVELSGPGGVPLAQPNGTSNGTAVNQPGAAGVNQGGQFGASPGQSPGVGPGARVR